MSEQPAIIDKLGRPIRDLRISVTDRCNFRCVYCMPKEIFDKQYEFLPRRELLDFEEIERVVRLFAGFGVRKIRLTGGEPMVRHGLETLIADIARIPGIDDISMTTNASLMTRERAEVLYAVGLQRVNISLDAMDDARFQAVNDVGCSVQKVLDGIHIASEIFDTVKVNMVVKKGLNEDQILPMARFFHGTGVILRFIEFMDVGSSNGWQREEVFTSRQIRDLIDAEMPIESTDPNYEGEVAERWRYADGGGEIGIISSVSKPFCRDCHRARLSAVGQLFTCLFAGGGHDLRSRLRDGSSDEELREHIAALWQARDDRYSELRGQKIVFRPKVEMSYIGG